MNGRRAEDERGEVFQGGGPGTAGRDREIGVRAATLGADPGRSSADSRGGHGGNGSTGGGPVPVAVPEATGADADATPLRTDSATRLNAGRTSPTGVDRGGHVHRVDVPKTPAQAGDRDALSPAETPDENEGHAAALDAPDDAAADPEELARLADFTDLAGPELVGRRLHLARRQAGLGVEDITAATRIRGTMIRQIESGDFSRCGGEVYARGHVRTLAKVVGLDAEDLLDERVTLVVAAPPAVRPSASAPVSAPQPKSRTKEEKAEPGPTPSRARIIRSAKAQGAAAVPAAAGPALSVPAASADPSDVITREPKSANWTAAMLVALLGLVVFAGMQLVGDDKPAPAAAAHVPPPPAKPAAPPPPAPTPTGVAVKVAAAGADSWLAVFSADGHKLYDNLLAAGSAQSFQDKAKLEVIVGNAAAIKLQLNGKDMAPIGGDGQVVRVLVNPTGVVQG